MTEAADESRFRELFDTTSDAVAFFDVLAGRHFILDGLNPAGERLLGLRLADARGRSLHELLPPGVAELVLRSFQQAVEAIAGPTATEQRWTLPSGERWLHALLVPTRHLSMPAHRLAVVWRDLNPQKAYEKALADREEIFRRLVETTNVIPWEADFPTRRFTYVGFQAVKHFGYPEASWYTENFWTDHIHPDDRDETVAACRRLASTASEYDLEYRLLTREGSVVWVHDLVNVWVDRRGQVLLRGFLVDVTARRRAEEEVRRLNSELECRVAERTAQLAAANKELEAFCYSVSHDLRAPLRAIDGFSKALGEDYDHCLEEDGRDMLRRVRAASQRMGGLIDDLLILSRVTRSDMRRARVDLSTLATGIAQALAATAPQRRVDWIIAPGLAAIGDPALLRVVLENLLDNSWKYTSRQPRARIEVGCTSDAFFVKDDGAGFDPAYADKLFRPFQRLHRPDEFEGHGIGLATVQRIVHRHGGEVRAESAVGQGATFYFTL